MSEWHNSQKQSTVNIKKGLRFLAHIIQTSWLGGSLLKLIALFDSEEHIIQQIEVLCEDGEQKLSRGSSNITLQDV